jgi:DNA-directed RNA polymerase subunit RPC12/RpoP
MATTATINTYKTLREDVYYPKKAVVYLKNNLPQGNIFAPFGWGGYLVWHLPEKKVFISGQMPHWGNLLDEYSKIVSLQSPFEKTPAPSSAVPSTSALASDLSLRQVQADSRGLEESDTAGAQEEYLLLKPERLAAIAAVTSAAGGKKKERPKFVHTCSRCGKTWELAIQLDPSRPMYCPECRPIVLEEKKNRGSVVKQITRTPPPPELTTVHHKEVSELSFAHEAQLPSAPPASKPRIVHDSPSAYAAEPRGMIKVVVDQQTSPERLSMLEEIAQSKNQALELDKKVLEAVVVVRNVYSVKEKSMAQSATRRYLGWSSFHASWW